MNPTCKVSERASGQPFRVPQVEELRKSGSPRSKNYEAIISSYSTATPDSQAEKGALASNKRRLAPPSLGLRAAPHDDVFHRHAASLLDLLPKLLLWPRSCCS